MKHALLLGLLLSSTALAQKSGELPETYVVQPGDTCMDIAKKFFGSASEYPRLHEHNDMGPLPHNLKPGSIVRLRAATQENLNLKSDATLTAFHATVNTRSAKMNEWKNAERNQPLFRLDEVHTLSKASADILFRDHSTLQMKQNALIVIYGGSSSKARSKKAGGVKLLQGELGLSLADLRKTPVEIVTPSVEVSARATQAIVDVDSNQTSRVSIQQGEAKVTAQGKSVRLKSGQGVRVQKNSPPEPPMQLPHPPAWANAKTHELHLTQGTQQLAATLQWTQPPSPPSASPLLYRVEVAQDSLFQHPTLEKTTNNPEFPLSELPPGTSYVRMRTIDETGLISSPSPPKRLDILKVEAPSTPAQEASAEALTTQSPAQKTTGQVPFNMGLILPEDVSVFLNGKLASLPLVIQHPGKHLVEFKTMDAQQSISTEVETMPPPFSWHMHLNKAEKPELWIVFEAPIPQDAQLKAQGLHGTLVGPLSSEDNQTFKATLSGHRPYQLHVLWGDYTLGNLQESPETPSHPSARRALPQPSFPENAQHTAILRERTLGSLALPTTYLPESLQLNTALDVDFFKKTDKPTGLRLSARLDAPFKQGSYFANVSLVNKDEPPPTNSNAEAGKISFIYPELAIGTQMQFPLTKHLSPQWTAGFAADFAGNLNFSSKISTKRQPTETLLRLRAMGTFGYHSKGFSVSTTQGFAGEYANSLRSGWIGSISALWHMWPKFLLAAQVDGQKISSRGFASAAAVGLRLLVGPVELGLAGHAGLSPEGRSQWGNYGASLSFGIR
ncbi:MAG: FecR domain-containing protein [Cystobacterineae bacterium]|nr:FecR domain-containing protein [Cystobacterineae bacterium]